MKGDILVIGARGIPNIQGGLEKHAEMLFPHFAQNGFMVTLVGIRGVIKETSYKGVRLVGLQTVSFFNTDKIVYNLLGLVYAIRKRPRLVHLQGLNAGLFLAFYRLFRLNVVLRYGSQDYKYPKWGFLGRLALRACELQLPLAHHVITVSHTYRNMLVKKYGIKHVTVVPNGVERLQEPADPEAVLKKFDLLGRKFVLSVGRITPEKDYRTLIQGFEVAGLDDYCLVIAGGTGDAAYHREIETSEGGLVRLPGQVSREDLAALYANCQIYVCSSIHEGQSNALLEAVAFRKPIIASDIPANIEVGLETACYFAVGDGDALAGALVLAADEPDQFAQQGTEFGGWDEVYERTREVYCSVVPEFG